MSDQDTTRRERATRTVDRHARDAEELAELLDMLGLSEPAEPQPPQRPHPGRRLSVRELADLLAAEGLRPSQPVA